MSNRFPLSAWARWSALTWGFLNDWQGELPNDLLHVVHQVGLPWQAFEPQYRTFWSQSQEYAATWLSSFPGEGSLSNFLDKVDEFLFVEIEGMFIPLPLWLGREWPDLVEQEFYPVVLKNEQHHTLLKPFAFAHLSATSRTGDIRSFSRFHDGVVWVRSWWDGSEWPFENGDILEGIAYHWLRWQIYDASVQLYRSLFSRHPETRIRNRYFAALCFWGSQLFKTRQFGAAVRAFQDALQLKSDLPQLYYNLAMAHIQLGQPDRARNVLESLLEKHPPTARAYELLGDIAVREQQWSEAEIYYRMALQIEPTREGLQEKVKRLQKLQPSSSLAVEANKESAKVPQESSKDGMNLEQVLVPIPGKASAIPILGRESEVHQIMEILTSGYKPSVLLVGEPGVGKTAVIHESVRRLKDIQPGTPAFQLQLGALVAGAKFRGQLEERIQRIAEELTRISAILVIEDLHQLVPSSSSRAIAQEATLLLREKILEGNLRVLASTTPDEYRNTIEKDPPTHRCFQMVSLMELEPRVVLDILEYHRGLIEKDKHISVDPQVITQIPNLVSLYLKGRAMPDRGIEVFYRTVSHVSLNERSRVHVDDLYSTLADMAHVPGAYIRNQALMDWAALQNALRQRIIGQDHAIEAVLRVLKASTSGFRFHPERPRGVFLFVGPSGVGKTEFAQALTDCWMGDTDRLIRIDMSEYMERYSVSRLIGASPGYVGYYDANQLVDKVRQTPFSLILLDEVEKADPQLLQIFLQVFDAGRLTDGRGRTAYFNNTVIIMTSNLGTYLYSKEPLGYQQARPDQDNIVLREIKRWLPPEFLNRIDDIIVFQPLSPQAAEAIVSLKLAKVTNDLAREGKHLVCEPPVIDWFVRNGFHPEYGARYLERTIEKCLLAPLAEKRETAEWLESTTVNVTVIRDQPEIHLHKETWPTSRESSEQWAIRERFEMGDPPSGLR